MDAKIKQIDIPFKKGDPITPEQAMKLALEIAVMGAPYVSPNPLVGCVIVDSYHHFLAYGFHRQYGQAHAEIDALKNASSAELNDSIFYVTLEPCAHEGKTGSCAKKIATLPVKKVVYGLVDPNPLVQGQGAQILKDTGIETVEYQGPLKVELQQLCEIFLKNFVKKEVFVSAKVAMSLDGQMALKTGESKWITSEASREYVHELRSYYDAILVGRHTIHMDNPSLNVRHPSIQKESKIIILDPRGELLRSVDAEKYKFMKAHQENNIFFAVHKKVETKYQQIEFSNLKDLCEKLWAVGIRSLFIEGGAKTYSSFLTEDLIDRLYLFIAPAVFGAATGRSWAEDFGISELNDKLKFDSPKVQVIGSDIFITVKKSASSSGV